MMIILDIINLLYNCTATYIILYYKIYNDGFTKHKPEKTLLEMY